MEVICDYHIHTYLCKHAVGEPESYVETAIKKGLKSIGLSDHCPVPKGYDPENRMIVENFAEYKAIVRRLKEKFEKIYDIEILFGMEIDWVPGRMNELESFIEKNNFDYLIGSIHYVDELPFDHPDHIDKWKSSDGINYVWNKYFEDLYKFIQWGRFDIIGHIDLPKKFSMRPKRMDKIYERLEKIFSLAAEKNIMLEINTSGLRKHVKEIYPSEEILKLAYHNNIKIVFGSDAHSPNEVGKDFDTAAQMAANSGYKEYYNIKGKKITL
ncbi:MAG: histidinol-phosphatase HisJ [Victivallales bacterium]|nr:histidinol-phosphatase HisJ [Victivallales bacterium]